MEQARDAVLSEERLRPFARGYRAGIGPRARAISARWPGLGMIMQDLGDEKRALEAFRKALAINPHLDKVPELVKDPERKGRRPRYLTLRADRCDRAN
jgi:hypothetical protein